MNTIRLLLSLFFLIAGSFQLTVAQGAGLDEIIAKVQKSFDETKWMTAAFTQESTNKAFGRVTVSNGFMTMVKPAKMRWEYIKPKGMLLVADGVKLWYFDPDDNVAYFDNLTGYLHHKSPALFLAGEEPLLSLFDIDLVSNRKEDNIGSLRLKLTPKEPQPGVKAILLKVDAEIYEIKEIIMVDYLGNKNRLIFSDIDRSAKPDPSKFHFTPPKGVLVKAMPRVSGQ